MLIICKRVVVVGCLLLVSLLLFGNEIELKGVFLRYGNLEPKFDKNIYSYSVVLPNSDLNNLNYVKLLFDSEDKLDRYRIIINGVIVAKNERYYFFNSTDCIKISLINLDKNKSVIYYIFFKIIKPVVFKNDTMYYLYNDKIEINKQPRYIDKYGDLYGVNGDSIFKTTDGKNWELLTVVDSLYRGLSDGPPVIALYNKKIIIPTRSGKCIVSKPNQKWYNDKMSFYKDGMPTMSLGYSVINDTIVLLGTYKTSSDTIEVYYSRDGGEVFNRIYISNRYNRNVNYHVHTVEYDWYDNGIIIITGDGENNSMKISYDEGNSWNTVFEYDKSIFKRQFTQLIPLKNGYILGSDFGPDGLYYLPKENNEYGGFLLNKDNIEPLCMIGDNNKYTIRYAVRYTTISDGRHIGYILPWIHYSQIGPPYKIDSTRLWLSFDGLRWYELFSWNSEWNKGNNIFGFNNIVAKVDEKNRYIRIYSTFSGRYMFSGYIRLPRKKLIAPDVTIEYDNNNPIIRWNDALYGLDYSVVICKDETMKDTVDYVKNISATGYFCNKLEANHDYYVSVRAYGFYCNSDWSKPKYFRTKSIIYNTIPWVNIYPNPADSSIRLSMYLTASSVVEIILYSIDSTQKYYRKEHVAKGYYVNDLDVKELPAGTYMLKVRNIGDNTDSITKILIKH